MDAHKPSYELRVRNVSLHRRGNVETGTLYVTRHHLIFSYQPGTTNQATRVASRQQLSNLSGESTGSEKAQSGGDENAQSKQGEGKGPQQQQSRPRLKEVYVPYPLIQRCVLRPSLAQSGHRVLTNTDEDISHIEGQDKELFPPTIGTNQYGRSSTDSTSAHILQSPRRPASPLVTAESAAWSRPPALRLRCKDFNIMAFHFHSGTSDKSADEHARQVFYSLRDRCCVRTMEDMYAYHFQPPAEEISSGGQKYNETAEFARMGIHAGAPADSVGREWRTTDINAGYGYSSTYPQVLAVPRAVSDNILKYCGNFRSKARIPALAYLHPNGGTITRSSQPLVGLGGKRNPQDEKLVSAIFCSHSRKSSPNETPPNEPDINDLPQTTSDNNPAVNMNVDADQVPTNENSMKPRVYGSTRRNLIVDARPRVNMVANKAFGGGIEDVANYTSAASDVPVEKVFLNIANIHSMRSALEHVVDALGNADYVDLPPDQGVLRSCKWLGHIANILDGAEMVARVVGLGASHALIHCSDGWDRTSQISALAQVMLDPHYRTLKGFITLVQKDFLSFGHKFRHRQGVEGSEKWFEIENERVQPSRTYQNGVPADTNHLQVLGSKALSGARNWFDKNRANLFGQQSSTSSPESLSRPRTPPPNAVLHSTPSPNVKEEKHKMDEKEVAPIFHQFLDAVYQLMYQEPSSFEFNERFLRRLFYHSYSGQYGEFLFNTERDRSQKEGKLPSVWAYFLAREHEFKNSQYTTISGAGMIFPRRHGPERNVEVRWWASLFGRKDEEMNIQGSYTSVDVSALTAQASSTTLHEAISSDSLSGEAGSGINIRAARSTPALHSTREEVDGSPRKTRSISSVISFDGAADESEDKVSKIDDSIREVKPVATFDQIQADADAWSDDGVVISATPTKQPKVRASKSLLGYNDDSPSDTTTTATIGRAGGLDFAAFAQQNAFRER